MIKNKTILIVEDDLSLREIFFSIFELEGYQVLAAENGQEALDILTSLEACSLPDCILLDIMMPVMNGQVFLSTIRNFENLNQIPVIVCSAYGHFEMFPQIRGQLLKPVELDQLINAVSGIFNIPRPSYEPSLLAIS